MSAPLRTGFRPQIIAERGVVATEHSLASTLALGVLMRGGNAVDAAVTAAIALAVLRPDTGGPGGDAFALIHWARAGRTFALNASGPAPAGTDPDRFRPHGLPRAGILTACLPGAAAAWGAALERFGTLSLAEAAAPAVELAERGMPTGFVLSRIITQEAAVLAEDPAAAEIFLPGGKPPGPFDRLVQKALAETLRRIGQEGPAALYKGAIGDQLVRWMRDQGGWFAPEDFGRVSAEWGEPLSTEYRGHEVQVAPPVSHAHMLLAELNIVEGDDLARLGQNSEEAIHLMVEAKKLAFADRDQFTGDPAWETVPIAELVGRARGRRLRAEIGPSASDVRPRIPLGADTTYLAVADRDGNAVSFIQSLFHPFGSARVAGKTGIVLNNRMLSFSLDPASPNRMEAGRRPITTLAPSMVLRRGRPRFVAGSPGGDAQVQAVFQVLVNLLDHGLDVQPAVEAPRWRSQDSGELSVETRIGAETLEGLRQRGHRVVPGGDWTQQMGGVQLVAVDAERGWLLAGADPRREGYAVGH